jgi:hypothetical protein
MKEQNMKAIYCTNEHCTVQRARLLTEKEAEEFGADIYLYARSEGDAIERARRVIANNDDYTSHYLICARKVLELFGENVSLPANSLEELLQLIRADHDNAIDMSSLPTFGGETPEDTMGIWSWDRHRLLVGDGFEDLRIIDRHAW